MFSEIDYILCECPLEPLKSLVETLEVQYEIVIPKEPCLCLTMLKAEDSVERQAFYLGEALTTDCEVTIRGHTGYGVVLEDQPERAYCIAVIDALVQINDHNRAVIEAFLTKQWQGIQLREKQEYHNIMQSAVDFKLMDEI